MVEKKAEKAPQVLDGKAAYEKAMRDLESTWNVSEIFRTVYPQKCFNYGEDGRGLVLPKGLVYISSECAEDIMAIDGDMKIVNFWMISGQFRSINGEIPKKAIQEVLQFTSELRAQCQEVLQDRSPQL